MQDNRTELDRVMQQEASLILNGFTPDDAWWLGSRLYEVARDRAAPVSIEVHLGHARRFAALLPGATADNAAWVDRKAAVAWRFEQSSYAVSLRLKSGENLFDRYGLDYQRHAASGGAVPIKLDGAGMVGVVGVSGLPPADDHQLVVDALIELKARQQGIA